MPRDAKAPNTLTELCLCLQIGLGLATTVLALGFVGQVAKNAIEEMEAESDGK